MVAAAVAAASILLTVVISKYTLVHPYMLADNRSVILCFGVAALTAVPGLISVAICS